MPQGHQVDPDRVPSLKVSRPSEGDTLNAALTESKPPTRYLQCYKSLKEHVAWEKPGGNWLSKVIVA